MKVFKIIIESAGLCGLMTCNLLISYGVIASSFNGWEHTINFNKWGEGIFEVIIIPLLTAVGVIVSIKYIIRLLIDLKAKRIER